MSEMKVYIANLGKYNEGEMVGAWFTPPINEEDLSERIGLNDSYEEYAIHDYELPFEIDEYTPIPELNHQCAAFQEIEGTPVYEEIGEIQRLWFSSLEELLENVDDIIYYPGCESMADVAAHLVEETGQLGEIPPNLQSYIDYPSLGYDMAIEGNFLVTGHGVFQYID